jgi:hypothetical protein
VPCRAHTTTLPCRAVLARTAYYLTGAVWCGGGCYHGTARHGTWTKFCIISNMHHFLYYQGVHTFTLARKVPQQATVAVRGSGPRNICSSKEPKLSANGLGQPHAYGAVESRHAYGTQPSRSTRSSTCCIIRDMPCRKSTLFCVTW